MNARLRQHAFTSVVVAVLLVATGAPRAQSKPGLTISNLRTGEVAWDKKNGLSIPITVDFEIWSRGPPKSTELKWTIRTGKQKVLLALEQRQVVFPSFFS
jgi:hypothetical protein